MAVDDLTLRPEKAAAGLKVSSYDRTSSLLIAMLLLVGAAVIGVVIVFFSNRIQRALPAIPVTAVAPFDSAAPAEGDLADVAPGDENAPEDAVEDLESLLEQVTLAATNDAVLMSNEGALASATAVKGDPRGAGGSGTGRGPSREPRREIRFEPQSMRQYADWFDKAGLELGVLGTDNLVYYASKLSTPTPIVRTGSPEEDKRLYFNSTGGPLYPLDRQLAKKAGIADKGQWILQFCSPATQQKLLALEKVKADGRPTSDISRTVFRVVKGASDSFDFEVEEQQYYR